MDALAERLTETIRASSQCAWNALLAGHTPLVGRKRKGIGAPVVAAVNCVLNGRAAAATVVHEQ